jgi:hypothetical protein
MRKLGFRSTLVLLVVVLAILSGCASTSSMMIRSETMLVPSPDYAIVNFLRPSSMAFAIKFGIWDKENVVGVLTTKNYIQYKASPGEHIFMARAENWSVIKATVDAGKTYYILAAPRMGAWKARVGMEVIRPDDVRLSKWMDSVEPITFDPAQREAYENERVDDVRKAVKNVQDGKAEFDVMKPTDGR